MMSESRSNAQLTELQVKELEKLDDTHFKTERQKERHAELVLKQEKSKEIVLSDTCIAYLMEHYAWVTQKMVSVSKEMDIDYLNKGKIQDGQRYIQGIF